MAAGFCAHGIAGAGGIGRQMASWIVDGEPELDLWKMDIRRFGPAYRSQAYTLARTTEVYATYYDIHYPNEERAGRASAADLADVRDARWTSGRPSARSRAGSARTGSNRTRPTAMRPCVRAAGRGCTGRPAIGAEALATRRTAGLFDETSFAKLEIVGPGAIAFLGRMCANDIDRAGRLDRLHAAAQPARRDRGDLTVTRVAADRLPAGHRAPRSGSTTWGGSAGTCPTTVQRARSAT